MTSVICDEAQMNFKKDYQPGTNFVEATKVNLLACSQGISK